MAPQMFLFGSRVRGRFFGIHYRAFTKRRHNEMCIHKGFQQESDYNYNTSHELWNLSISELLRVTFVPVMLYRGWEFQWLSYRSAKNTYTNIDCEKSEAQNKLLLSMAQRHVTITWRLLLQTACLQQQLSTFPLGLGDILHAICMRISSVKPVPWLAVNLHHLFSNGAAFNTQSHSSQTSYAYIDWYIAFDMNAILRSLSVIYGSVY